MHGLVIGPCCGGEFDAALPRYCDRKVDRALSRVRAVRVESRRCAVLHTAFACSTPGVGWLRARCSCCHRCSLLAAARCSNLDCRRRILLHSRRPRKDPLVFRGTTPPTDPGHAVIRAIICRLPGLINVRDHAMTGKADNLTQSRAPAMPEVHDRLDGRSVGRLLKASAVEFPSLLLLHHRRCTCLSGASVRAEAALLLPLLSCDASWGGGTW